MDGYGYPPRRNKWMDSYTNSDINQGSKEAADNYNKALEAYQTYLDNLKRDNPDVYYRLAREEPFLAFDSGARIIADHQGDKHAQARFDEAKHKSVPRVELTPDSPEYQAAAKAGDEYGYKDEVVGQTIEYTHGNPKTADGKAIKKQYKNAYAQKEAAAKNLAPTEDAAWKSYASRNNIDPNDIDAHDEFQEAYNKIRLQSTRKARYRALQDLKKAFPNDPKIARAAAETDADGWYVRLPDDWKPPAAVQEAAVPAPSAANDGEAAKALSETAPSDAAGAAEAGKMMKLSPEEATVKVGMGLQLAWDIYPGPNGWGEKFQSGEMETHIATEEGQAKQLRAMAAANEVKATHDPKNAAKYRAAAAVDRSLANKVAWDVENTKQLSQDYKDLARAKKEAWDAEGDYAEATDPKAHPGLSVKDPAALAQAQAAKQRLNAAQARESKLEGVVTSREAALTHEQDLAKAEEALKNTNPKDKALLATRQKAVSDLKSQLQYELPTAKGMEVQGRGLAPIYGYDVDVDNALAAYARMQDSQANMRPPLQTGYQVHRIPALPQPDNNMMVNEDFEKAIARIASPDGTLSPSARNHMKDIFDAQWKKDLKEAQALGIPVDPAAHDRALNQFMRDVEATAHATAKNKNPLTAVMPEAVPGSDVPQSYASQLIYNQLENQFSADAHPGVRSDTRSAFIAYIVDLPGTQWTLDKLKKKLNPEFTHMADEYNKEFLPQIKDHPEQAKTKLDAATGAAFGEYEDAIEEGLEAKLKQQEADEKAAEDAKAKKEDDTPPPDKPQLTPNVTRKGDDGKYYKDTPNGPVQVHPDGSAISSIDQGNKSGYDMRQQASATLASAVHDTSFTGNDPFALPAPNTNLALARAATAQNIKTT